MKNTIPGLETEQPEISTEITNADSTIESNNFDLDEFLIRKLYISLPAYNPILRNTIRNLLKTRSDYQTSNEIQAIVLWIELLNNPNTEILVSEVSSEVLEKITQLASEWVIERLAALETKIVGYKKDVITLLQSLPASLITAIITRLCELIPQKIINGKLNEFQIQLIKSNFMPLLLDLSKLPKSKEVSNLNQIVSQAVSSFRGIFYNESFEEFILSGSFLNYNVTNLANIFTDVAYTYLLLSLLNKFNKLTRNQKKFLLLFFLSSNLMAEDHSLETILPDIKEAFKDFYLEYREEYNSENPFLFSEKMKRQLLSELIERSGIRFQTETMLLMENNINLVLTEKETLDEAELLAKLIEDSIRQSPQSWELITRKPIRDLLEKAYEIGKKTKQNQKPIGVATSSIQSNPNLVVHPEGTEIEIPIQKQEELKRQAYLNYFFEMLEVRKALLKLNRKIIAEIPTTEPLHKDIASKYMIKTEEEFPKGVTFLLKKALDAYYEFTSDPEAENESIDLTTRIKNLVRDLLKDAKALGMVDLDRLEAEFLEIVGRFDQIRKRYIESFKQIKEGRITPNSIMLSTFDAYSFAKNFKTEGKNLIEMISLFTDGVTKGYLNLEEANQGAKVAQENLSINAMRLSVPISKIVSPRGKNNFTINEVEIDTFITEVKNLVSQGLKPVITFQHFELPYGWSWLDKDITFKMSKLADAILPRLLEIKEIEDIITINEPDVEASQQLEGGEWSADVETNPILHNRAIRNMIKVHTVIYKKVHTLVTDRPIYVGVSSNIANIMHSNKPLLRPFSFVVKVFGDMVNYGVLYVLNDMKVLDRIYAQIYFNRISPLLSNVDSRPTERAGHNQILNPENITAIVKDLKRRFSGVSILISEFGADLPADERMKSRYLIKLLKAIVKVLPDIKGAFLWSLWHTFEIANIQTGGGWDANFGLGEIKRDSKTGEINFAFYPSALIFAIMLMHLGLVKVPVKEDDGESFDNWFDKWFKEITERTNIYLKNEKEIIPNLQTAEG